MLLSLKNFDFGFFFFSALFDKKDENDLPEKS